MAAEGSMTDDNDVEINSEGSGDEGERVRKRPKVECTKGGKLLILN